MTKEQAFSILGIDPTDDSDAITAAYRHELPNHHPEDDAAGFKMLREAYEEALRIAREGDDDGQIKTVDFADASGPVASVMRRVMDIYADYPKRIDPKVWEELLDDPLFSDFEYEMEARFSILLFISEHFRMPAPVYKVFDSKLLIREHVSELSERLPENFITFLVNTATSEDDGWEFRFEALSDYPVPDRDGSIDRFIGELLPEIGRNPSDDDFASDETLTKLGAYGMKHPYLDLLLIRAKAKKEETVTPEDIDLVTGYREKYPIDQRILNDTIVIYAYAKENERLKSLCSGILDDMDADKHVETFAKYYAYYHLGRLAYENEDYEEALDKLASASAISYSQAVKELLDKVGQYEIDLLTKKEELSDEEAARLAEVYRVTNRAEEGAAYFDENPTRRAATSEFSYHLACIRLMLNDVDKLFEEVERGRKLLEEEREAELREESEKLILEEDDATDGSEAEEDSDKEAGKKSDPEKKKKEYTRHLGKFRCLEAQAHVGRAEDLKEDDENRQIEFSKALAILDEVEEETPDLAYFDDMRMHVYRERNEEGDANRIIEIAERLLSESEDHYNAASQMQAAYEMLHDVQGVINSFYRARAIYDKDPVIYERVMAVFCDIEEYDEALRIAELAEKTNVESDKINAYRYFSNAMKTEADTDRMDLLIKALELADDLAPAHYYLGVCYYNRIRNDESAEKSLKDEWKEKAYTNLKFAADNGYRGIWLYWVLANYSDDRDDRVSAIKYMTYVIDNDEDAIDQLSRVGSWAQMEYYDTHIESYANMAIEYCDRSDKENGKTPATFFDRGYVYYVRGDYEKSIEQFLGLIEVVAALDEDEDNRLYHTRLRGTAYEIIAEDHLYLHDYDEAIEYAVTALEEFDIPEFYHRQKSIYKTIYQAYLWKKDFKKGILFFDGQLSKFNMPGHWCSSDNGKRLNHENIREMEHFVRNLALCDGERGRALDLTKKLNGGSLEIDNKPEWFSWTWKKKSADDLFWMAQSFHETLGYDMKEALHAGERIWKSGYDRSKLHFEEDATHGQLTETRSYINFLRLMAQQLTIYGYDDVWADDILHRAYYAANLLGDRFGDWDDLYNWWMWNAYFRGDKAAAAEYGEKYKAEWANSHKYTNDKKLDLEDAVKGDFNYRKSALFTLCEIAIANGQIEQLKNYIEQMEGCRNCPQCIYKTCYEQIVAKAWLSYLEGDLTGAYDLAERALKLTWDHNCDYAEMLTYRCLNKETIGEER